MLYVNESVLQFEEVLLNDSEVYYKDNIASQIK